ncbi:hypothetical protein ADL05_21685 [Nocardiopsis sp. NRRL B-16309]|nr:hypothetical protein ADL05_21685 [Nocardiopsis sp. NRRL B-16309]
MSRREDAQFGLTMATCYLGAFTAISLLSGDWMYLVLGLLRALVAAPLMFGVGFVVYKLSSAGCFG